MLLFVEPPSYLFVTNLKSLCAKSYCVYCMVLRMIDWFLAKADVLKTHVPMYLYAMLRARVERIIVVRRVVCAIEREPTGSPGHHIEC